jgi:hypothetical protein
MFHTLPEIMNEELADLRGKPRKAARARWYRAAKITRIDLGYSDDKMPPTMPTKRNRKRITIPKFGSFQYWDEVRTERVIGRWQNATRDELDEIYRATAPKSSGSQAKP